MLARANLPEISYAKVETLSSGTPREMREFWAIYSNVPVTSPA